MSNARIAVVKPQVEQLQSENKSLKQQNQELQQELSNAAAPDVPQLPDLSTLRDRVLRTLTSGKGKVATTSPQYKAAARALDRFISELRESAAAPILFLNRGNSQQKIIGRTNVISLQILKIKPDTND